MLAQALLAGLFSTFIGPFVARTFANPYTLLADQN